MVNTAKNITDSKIVDIIEIPEAIVRMRSDGIVHTTFRQDTVFDIALQLKILEINIKITGGKRSYFIYDAEDNVTITREARDNAVKIEHLAPVKGSVVVANNLAYRIIANFYVQFNKPATPFKVVRSLEEGLKWLKNLPA